MNPVAWLVFQASVAAAPPPCGGELYGRVVDRTTAEPVAEARVVLEASPEAPRVVLTDETGEFRFAEVCPGPWKIALERADYESETRRGTLGHGAGQVQVDVAIEPRLTHRLEDMVVEAPAPAEAGAGLNTALGDEALERLRGRSFTDALARLPGVSVLRSSAGGLGQPILRGQFGRRNLVIYDGVRHEGQRWGIEHAPEIDPWAVGRMSVERGARAIRYGPEAVGGVVLVEPPAMPTEPGITGQADLVGVSNGRRGTAALRVDGAHARVPGLAWRVDGNVTRGAALMAPDYPLDNTGLWTWNVGARLKYTRRAFDVELSYRHHFMQAGICTCLRVDSVASFEQATRHRRPLGVEHYTSEYRIDRPYQRVEHDLAVARTRVTAGRAGDVHLTYAFQDNRRDEYEVVRQSIGGPQFSFGLRTHFAEAVFAHVPAAVGRGSVLEGQVGATFMHQRNAFDSSNTLVPDARHDAAAVFVVERWVAPRVEVELGGRYDLFFGRYRLTRLDYGGQRQRLGPDRCDETSDRGAECGAAFHTGSASLGVLGRPVASVPEFTIRFDATSTGRVPSIDELFLNGSAPSFPVLGVGNPQLGIERTWGLGLTVAHASPWIAAEGSAYANTIEDYIYFAPAGGGMLQETIRGVFPVFEYRPVDAIFYGGELGFVVRPPPWPVEFDGQMSWVRARDLTRDGNLAFIPPDRYRLGVTYRWPDVWRLRDGYVAVRGTFVDRQRHPSAEDFAPPPRAYGLLEAEVGTDVQLAAQRLRFALVGGNLTNARYRDYTSLLRYFADEPGWELMVRISLVFTGRRRSAEAPAASARLQPYRSARRSIKASTAGSTGSNSGFSS